MSVEIMSVCTSSIMETSHSFYWNIYNVSIHNTLRSLLPPLVSEWFKIPSSSVSSLRQSQNGIDQRGGCSLDSTTGPTDKHPEDNNSTLLKEVQFKVDMEKSNFTTYMRLRNVGREISSTSSMEDNHGVSDEHKISVVSYQDEDTTLQRCCVLYWEHDSGEFALAYSSSYFKYSRICGTDSWIFLGNDGKLSEHTMNDTLRLRFDIARLFPVIAAHGSIYRQPHNSATVASAVSDVRQLVTQSLPSRLMKEATGTKKEGDGDMYFESRNTEGLELYKDVVKELEFDFMFVCHTTVMFCSCCGKVVKPCDDVVVHVQANSFLLRCRTKVLRALLQGGDRFMETASRQMTIEEFTDTVIQNFVDFIHYDRCAFLSACDCDIGSVLSLLQAAHKYECQSLLDRCVGYLSPKVTKNNFTKILKLAEELNITELWHAVLNTMEQYNAKEFFETYVIGKQTEPNKQNQKTDALCAACKNLPEW
eukprot:GHVQ01031603.1.p1 GENE.GHVQ01031603.1~~GHVQ01031603.1.p1  ORF type:complete len:477 (+),score=70.54 GHVQ01031603.1:428-1858(+)